MNFIKRKVFLTKDLKPFDTNGDGVFNALVLSATTKSIQVPLTHSYDDMGVFEVSNDETFEIIDIISIFDDSITGITQPTETTGTTTTIDWGSGTSESAGGIEVNGDVWEYCGDTLANNYLILSGNSEDGYFLVNPTDMSTYTPPFPQPIFEQNNQLCSQTDTGIDSDNTEGQDNDTTSFPMQTIWVTGDGTGAPLPAAIAAQAKEANTLPECDWGYTTVLYGLVGGNGLADKVCQSLYNNTTARVLESIDFPPNLVQGNCLSQPPIPFQGLEGPTIQEGSCTQCYCGANVVTCGSCCSGCDTDTPSLATEVGNITYKLEYCFYCKPV